jgi:CheY-like chemotaxis protein/nitrogen-specific signal transduction histidine kinase/HPt (histidine-containing phosphotransfer) domain-containing protein
MIVFLLGILWIVTGVVFYRQQAALKRAEERARVKSELLASISHEIRNPLNSILALTRLLPTATQRNKQMEYVGGIHSSGKLLQMLMNNLLDFSLIESGKIQLESIAFDLEDVVHTVRKTFLYQALQRGTEIGVTFDEDLNLSVKGDPTRLSQVLMNLVGNAVKFTSEGRIQIDVRRMIGSGQEQVLFEVKDTGVGIEGSALQKLFHSFSQADVTISRKFGGTGLGLSISKRLVELMGGKISVQSVPGEGSVFSFTIHLPSVQRESVRAPREVLPSAEGIRILVAEDNHVNQLITVDMLAQLGFSADTAANGLEAVHAVQSHRYDLILMDCQMPEMSGYAAASMIRKNTRAGERRIPIVAVTGNVQPGDREACMAVGMDDFIPKPLEMKDLQRVLSRWLPEEEPAHIDLKRFQTVTGIFARERPERMDELVHLYLSSTREYLRIIELAFRMNDFEKLGQKVHSIKSSSENLGANILGKMAGDLERLCRENTGQIRIELLESMKREFDRVEVDLKRLSSPLDRSLTHENGAQ